MRLSLWGRLASLWVLTGPAAALREEIPQPGDVQTFFILLLYDIGLGPGAEVSLNITCSKPTDGTALLILTRPQWDEWRSHPLKKLHGEHAGYSSYLISHWRAPLEHRLSARIRISAPEPERYYIGVLNTKQQAMRLQGEVAYVNPGGQHLPLQYVHVPEALMASSIAFVVLMLVVAALLMESLRRGTRGATVLHALLVACLFFKSLELYAECAYLLVLSKQGKVPTWRFQVWQLSSRLHAIFEVLLLLMTALGWRLLRPRLSQTEIRFTVVTVSLTLSIAVLQACAGQSPILSFSLLFFMVQVACYLVIILAMNWNLTLIAVHLADSPVTSSVVVLYQKQQAFLLFRRVFLAIIIRPSAIAWLGFSVLDGLGSQWLLMLLDKASLWLIYVGLFMVLRPHGHRRRLLQLVLNTAAPGEASTETEDATTAAEAEEPTPSRLSAAAAAAAATATAAAAAEQAGATLVAAAAALGDGSAMAAEMARESREASEFDLAVPYVPLAGGA